MLIAGAFAGATFEHGDRLHLVDTGPVGELATWAFYTFFTTLGGGELYGLPFVLPMLGVLSLPAVRRDRARGIVTVAVVATIVAAVCGEFAAPRDLGPM